ncbi:MAG TPA: hypothetical protein VGS97_14320 [Actinocrinis sp.]|uniref:WD40 repeat domain-containing protein n=1 Tax=Actinocrinis sp. TaxID=1920516 RepID=UPI002DDD13FC|nr:hypothetical protein [Actinocrinis sp.]HEV2345270.1 hypothetical protein [Actinocrinis sp.]
MTGSVSRLRLRRRSVLLSGLAGLIAVGVPTGLYLTRARGVGRLAVLGTAVPFAYNESSTQAALSVRAVAFHPSGHALAAFDAGEVVTLWNIDDPSQPAPVTAHGAALQGVRGVFSPDGRVLATIHADGADSAVGLWDVADFSRVGALATLRGPAAGAGCLAIHPNGRVLAVASGDGQGGAKAISLWDITDPTAPAQLSATDPTGYAEIWGMSFSPDGHVLAVGSDGVTSGASGLWSVVDPRRPTALGEFALGESHAAGSGIFSPNGRIVATEGTSGSGDDGTVRIWDVVEPSHPVLLASFTGHSSGPRDLTEVNGLAFSPTGRVLATAGADSVARLWNVSDPRRPALIATVTGHIAALTGVAISPDGRVLATSSIDHTTRLWSISGL